MKHFALLLLAWIALALPAGATSSLQFEQIESIPYLFKSGRSTRLIAETNVLANSVTVVLTRKEVAATEQFFLRFRRNGDKNLGPFVIGAGERQLVLDLPLLSNVSANWFQSTRPLDPDFPDLGYLFDVELINPDDDSALDRGAVSITDDRTLASLDYSLYSEAPEQRSWSSPGCSSFPEDPETSLGSFLAAAKLGPSWESRLNGFTYWFAQADGKILAWTNASSGAKHFTFRADGTLESLESVRDERFARWELGTLPDGAKVGLSDYSGALLKWGANPASTEVMATLTHGFVWGIVRPDDRLEVRSYPPWGYVPSLPGCNGERLPGTRARLLLHPPEIISAVRQMRKNQVVRESAGLISVEVRKLGVFDRPLKVKYRTRDGTARAGSDYGSVAGEIQFQPYESRRWITIPIVKDQLAEGVEVFYLDFDSPGASATPHHPIYIQDDMRLEWRNGGETLRVWQPSYRTQIAITSTLSSTEWLGSPGGLVTPFADYLDVAPEIGWGNMFQVFPDGRISPELFFLRATGSDLDRWGGSAGDCE